MTRKFSVFVCLFFCLFGANAQKKWQLGLDIQTFQSTFLNIAQHEIQNDKLFYWGPSVHQNSALNYSIGGYTERRIGSRYSLDIGIRFTRIKNSLFIDYSVNGTSNPNHSTLNIKRNYFGVPINFNLYTQLAQKVHLKTSLGFISNFLIFSADNYNDITPFELMMPLEGHYRTLYTMGLARLGAQYSIGPKRAIALYLLGNLNLNPVTAKRPYFFYENLRSANEFQYGMGLNYIF